jgi:hypothetical protein
MYLGLLRPAAGRDELIQEGPRGAVVAQNIIGACTHVEIVIWTKRNIEWPSQSSRTRRNKLLRDALGTRSLTVGAAGTEY